MDRLNFSHQYIYTVSKILKIQYRYFNHSEANHRTLLRKGGTLGSGHHRMHSHWEVRYENNIKEMHD